MMDQSDYFQWLDGSWIRNSVRALIFNEQRDCVLVEKHVALNVRYYNFIGGGLEVGETMIDCLTREIIEETNARVTAATFVFAVENFFHIDGKPLHSLEHYFELTLDRHDVQPVNDGVLFRWLPQAELPAVDLRPVGVRNLIYNGRYTDLFHVVNDDRGANEPR